jgi:HD-GYP domain-containing protein (c-di-GMP phosphodiesterase class II)
MRSHPRLGFAIVRDLPFLRAAAECVVGHHERFDGQGYPLGLRGEDLPRAARIVAVADALDAMSVRRPYRRALSFERIHEELVTNRGSQFDPEVVDAAVHLFRSYADLHPDARASRRQAESELYTLPERTTDRDSRAAA